MESGYAYKYYAKNNHTKATREHSLEEYLDRKERKFNDKLYINGLMQREFSFEGWMK